MPDDFDYSQARPRSATAHSQPPLITYLLCSLCVLITAAYHAAGPLHSAFLSRVGHLGDLPVSAIWEGHYYGLLTAFFLHGDLFHILFNMLWLLRLGTILELTLPPWKYVVFLVTAQFASACAEVVVSGQPGIGASGVVYAIFGLLWAGRGRYPEWRSVATRENLNLFIIWGVFCLVGTLGHFVSVANGAHGGGFLFGLSVGWLFFAPRRRSLWAIPLALLGILCAISLTWMPWSAEWTFWKGNQQFHKGRYAAAISWYQRSLKRDPSDPSAWENIAAAWHNIAIDEEQKQHSDAAEKARQEEQSAVKQAGPDPQESGGAAPESDAQDSDTPHIHVLKK